MINKEDTYYPKDSKRLTYLFVLLVLVGITFFIYKTYFFSTAEYRYTIAVVTGEYKNSKSFGVTFKYKVGGDTITSSCIDNDCHYLKIGSRYIVKYFIERPSWNSLITQYAVPEEMNAPGGGWKEIPKW